MGSKFKRVQQWLVFSRMWYLYDAKWQNPFDSSEKIVRVLAGRHKPILGSKENYLGDHVVVINTKHIAMPNEEWKNRYYYHHTRYAKGATYTPVWVIHERDPTKVLYKAVYRQTGGNLERAGKIDLT